MMHIETSSILTSTFSRKKGLVMMNSSSSSHNLQQQQPSRQSSTQAPSPTLLHQQSSSSSSKSDPEAEWREISTKLSSDTATIFPLLQSKSSVSTLWPENSSHNPEVLSRTTSPNNDEDEEDKRVDTSFREDAVSHHPDLLNPVDYNKNRTKDGSRTTNPANDPYFVNNQRESANLAHDDDDSSAALSAYLQAKLARIWEDDDDDDDDGDYHHNHHDNENAGDGEDALPNNNNVWTASLSPKEPPKSIEIPEPDARELSQPPPPPPLQQQQRQPLHHHQYTAPLGDTETSKITTTSPQEWTSIPKPTEPLSRRQSAPSVVLRRHKHLDGLSVSDHSPLAASSSSSLAAPMMMMYPQTPPSFDEPSPSQRTSSPYRDRTFNPVTGYSPRRAARKRIWGSSNAHLPSTSSSSRRTPPRLTPSTDVSEEEEDESSVTSEEVLERISAHIKAELRYAELVELAEEAERAAEAGMESYSGQPWLYSGAAGGGGGGDADTLSPRLMRPNPIKRHASYSEGLPLPLSPLRKTTALSVGIKSLRDVEDVFPSFDSFHKNLRTHLLRERVSENGIIFQEVDLGNDGDVSPKDPHRRSFGTRDFMGNFNFQILRPKASRQSNSPGRTDESTDANTDVGLLGFQDEDYDSTDDEASDVGEVLAEHIHSTEHPIRRPLHPIVLPGLPRLEVSQQHSLHGVASRQRSIPLGPPNSSRAFGRAPSVDEESLVRPRILFHNANPAGLSIPTLSIEEGDDVFDAQTPVPQEGDTHDFVTPARLREIKRPKDGDMKDFLNAQSMILPVNSVIQESPFRTTPVSISSPHHRPSVARNRNIPVKDLLLPAFSAATDEESETQVRLAPSRSYDSQSLDDDDDDIAPNPLSPRNRAIAKRMPNRERSPPPMTPPGQGSKEPPKNYSPDNSFVSRDDNNINANKELTVEILDRSQDSRTGKTRTPSRTIIRPSVALAERDSPANRKVFTMRQIVPSTSQGSFDAIDCRCLSPSMHLEMQDLILDDEDEGYRQLSVKANDCRGSSALHGAMKIFKHMNPARNHRIAATRDLFVHPRVNDEFLQNYLYCSREPQKDEFRKKNDVCITSEPCQDESMCCGVEFSLARRYCNFVARDVACTPNIRSRNAYDMVHLSFNPHHMNETDSWFEAATERVDGMLENFIRRTTPKDDRFQPPSLRKVVRSGVRTSRTPITEPVQEESAVNLSSSTAAEGRPAVQPLFKHTENDLSDMQFALVYGTSRSGQHRAVSSEATSSPLRQGAVEKPASRRIEIPISYSTSSDEEEERLSFSMTYISEPSM